MAIWILNVLSLHFTKKKNCVTITERTFSVTVDTENNKKTTGKQQQPHANRAVYCIESIGSYRYHKASISIEMTDK